MRCRPEVPARRFLHLRRAPKGVIARINAAVGETMADATTRNRLTEMGYEIPTLDQQTPDALGAIQRAEIEKWWPIIKAASIKPE